jgi:hypothetical protein
MQVHAKLQGNLTALSRRQAVIAPRAVSSTSSRRVNTFMASAVAGVSIRAAWGCV